MSENLSDLLVKLQQRRKPLAVVGPTLNCDQYWPKQSKQLLEVETRVELLSEVKLALAEAGPIRQSELKQWNDVMLDILLTDIQATGQDTEQFLDVMRMLVQMCKDSELLYKFGLVLVAAIQVFPQQFKGEILDMLVEFYLPLVDQLGDMAQSTRDSFHEVQSRSRTDSSDISRLPPQVVRYSQALYAPLLQALIENDVEGASQRSTYQIMSNKCLNIILQKPDVAGDLLSLVAHSNEAVRIRCVRLLLSLFPRTFGHMVVSSPKELFGYSELLPGSSTKDLIKVRASVHVFYPHYFMKKETQPQISGVGRPRLITGKSHVGQQCLQCKLPVEGYGIKCHGCINTALHIQCYRRPKTAASLTKNAELSRHPHSLLSFVPNTPSQLYLSVVEPEVDGHDWTTVNLFVVSVCNHCQEPIWGIQLQAVHCRHCSLQYHFGCFDKIETAECVGSVKDSMETFQVDQFVLVDSFDKFYSEVKAGKSFSQYEAQTLYETLKLQEGLLIHAFKTHHLGVVGHPLGSFDNRSKLQQVLPNMVALTDYFEGAVESGIQARVSLSGFSLYRPETLVHCQILLSSYLKPVISDKLDFDDHGVIVADLSRLSIWSRQHLGFSTQMGSELLIQQLLITGMLDSQVVLGSQVKSVQIQQKNIIPQIVLCHPFDQHITASDLVYAIQTCLTSNVLAVQEFGLALLSRRCCPDLFVKLVPEANLEHPVFQSLLKAVISWMYTEDVLVEESPQRESKSGTPQATHEDNFGGGNSVRTTSTVFGTLGRLDKVSPSTSDKKTKRVSTNDDFKFKGVQSRFNNDQDIELNDAVIGLSDALAHMEGSGPKTSSQIRKLFHKKLVEKYIHGWIRKLVNFDEAGYADAVWTVVANIDPSCKVMQFVMECKVLRLGSNTLTARFLDSLVGKSELSVSEVFSVTAIFVDHFPHQEFNQPTTRSQVANDTAYMVLQAYQKYMNSKFAADQVNPLYWINVIRAAHIRFPSAVLKDIVLFMANLEVQTEQAQEVQVVYMVPPVEHFVMMLDVFWEQVLTSEYGFKGSFVAEIVNAVVQANRSGLDRFQLMVVHYESMQVTEQDVQFACQMYEMLLKLYNLLLYSGGSDVGVLEQAKFTAHVQGSTNKVCYPAISHSMESLYIKELVMPFLTTQITIVVSKIGNLSKFTDLKVQVVKFMSLLFNGQIAFKNIASILSSIASSVVPMLWTMSTSEYDFMGQTVNDLLMYFICFDMELKEFTSGRKAMDLLGLMRKSHFHACLYHTFEECNQQAYFAGLDNGFGIIQKISYDFIAKYEQQLWTLGPLVSYLIAGIVSQNDAVRLKCVSHMRFLDGVHLDYLLLIWSRYLDAQNDLVQKSLVLQMMGNLNGLFPALAVAKWQTLLVLMSPQRCLAIVQKYSLEFQVDMSLSEALKFQTQQDISNEVQVRNCNHFALSLAWQMLKNGITITSSLLQRVLLASSTLIGFSDAQIDSSNTGKGRIMFNNCTYTHELHRDAFLIFCRHVKQLFDRFYIQLTHDNMYTAGDEGFRVQFGKNLADKSAVHTGVDLTTKKLQLAEQSLPYLNNIFHLLTSVVSTSELLLTMDKIMAKCWLDCILVYVYKFDVESSEMQRKIVQVVQVILAGIASDTMGTKTKLFCINILHVLLKRSMIVTTPILAHAIVVMSKLIVKCQNNKSNPIVQGARKYLEVALDRFSETGIFVLLFKGELVPQLETWDTSMSSFDRNPAMFEVLFSVPVSTSEVVEPLADITQRLLKFTDFLQPNFNDVLSSLVLYMYYAKPVIKTVECWQDISKFLYECTTTSLPWQRSEWNFDAMLNFCSCLLDLYPKAYKFLIPDVEHVLLFGLRNCKVSYKSLNNLLLKGLSAQGKVTTTDKLDSLRETVIFELQKILTNTSAKCQPTAPESLLIVARNEFVSFHLKEQTIDGDFPDAKGDLIHGSNVNFLYNSTLLFIQDCFDGKRPVQFGGCTLLASELAVLGYPYSSDLSSLLKVSDTLHDRNLAVYVLLQLVRGCCVYPDSTMTLQIFQNWTNVMLFVRNSLLLIPPTQEKTLFVDPLILKTNLEDSTTLARRGGAVAKNNHYNDIGMLIKALTLLCLTVRQQQRVSVGNNKVRPADRNMTLIGQIVPQAELKLWSQFWPVARNLMMKELYIEFVTPYQGPQHFISVFIDMVDFWYNSGSDIGRWYGFDQHHFLEMCLGNLNQRNQYNASTLLMKYKQPSVYQSPQQLLSLLNSELSLHNNAV